MTESKAAYWLNRWQQGNTGWHETEVEPRLIEHFSRLAPTRVFVPLCGKSLDMAWLGSRGHTVVGVELSELACRSFFEEHEILAQKSKHGAFTAYTGNGITILQGDFFDLTPGSLGAFGAVFDRAALIALPKPTRVDYARHLSGLVRNCASTGELNFLLLALERDPSDAEGPPYSVSFEELEELYGRWFEIRKASRERIEMPSNPGAITEECVFLLSLKESVTPTDLA